MPDDLSAHEAKLAAEVEADVGVEHVGDVYARAFLGAAEKAGRIEALLEEFDSLLSDVLDRFPELERTLASRLVSHEQTAVILDRVFGGRASPVMLNFLKVVSRHERLDCLRAIHRRTHAQYERMRGLVRVKVATAETIPDALAGRIADQLHDVLGGVPVLEQIVDPELIGGMVVRVGDTVYDGSIATQLENVRQQMIDRSVHEIQSRRDRFSYPAGN